MEDCGSEDAGPSARPQNIIKAFKNIKSCFQWVKFWNTAIMFLCNELLNRPQVDPPGFLPVLPVASPTMFWKNNGGAGITVAIFTRTLCLEIIFPVHTYLLLGVLKLVAL